MLKGFAKSAFLAAALLSGAETLSAQRGGARPPPPRPAPSVSIAPEEEFSPPVRSATVPSVASEEEMPSGSAAQNQIFYTMQQQQIAALARTMAQNVPESQISIPTGGISDAVLNTLIADGSSFALDDAIKNGFPQTMAAYVGQARADLHLGDWPEADDITAAQRQYFISSLEKYWQVAVMSASSPQQAEQLGLDAEAASHLVDVQQKHNIIPGQKLDPSIAMDAYSDLSRGTDFGAIAGLGIGTIAVITNGMLLYSEIKKRRDASAALPT